MTAEVATERKMNVGMVLSPRIYWRVSGLLLALVAVLGIVVNILYTEPYLELWGLFSADFLAFDWTHNILHVVLAGIAIAFGWATLSDKLVGTAAIVFGAVYAVLAVVGFIKGDILSSINLSLETGENVIHAVLGIWGIAAGVLATTATTSK